jgi:hypothetical protein
MKSPLANAALIVPALIVGIGFIYAFRGPIPSGDWGGMTIFFRAGIGMGIAAIVAIVFCGLSFARREPRCEVSLMVAVPSVLYLGWIGVNIAEARFKEANSVALQAHQTTFHQDLKDDPSIALSLNWEEIWDYRRGVLIDSFRDSSVPFSLDQLRNLYGNYPSIRDFVFAHEACDSDFISSHFEEARALSFHQSYERLASICRNKNTPLNLLEEIASSEDIPVGAVHPAQYTLEKMRRESGPGE